MSPQTFTSALQIPKLLRSLPHSSNQRYSSNHRSQALVRMVALAALTLFLLPEMFAQQSPADGQYAPAPQSEDEQPAYAQPQPYGQQAYPQQSSPDSGEMDRLQGYGPDSQQGSGQVQPLNAQDLEQLVAPIALYPDALLAQVLTASTYPAQVVDADRWRRAQAYVPPDLIVAGADTQPWDPSVKALTAFPQVLAQMDQNLHWTSELGDAYYNQPQDVLEAVQLMRRRAQAAGNLQSTPQEAVNYDQGSIELAPANPHLVYVPTYNPWGVYGAPVSPYPGFSLLGAVGSFFGSTFGSGAVRFGLGIAMTAFSHTPWGFLAWGLNWLTQSVLFHQSNYYSRSTTVADWGLPHGGPRGFSQRGAMASFSSRSYRTLGGYGRPGSEYSGARSQAFERTRNEDAYARSRSEETYRRGYRAPSGSYGQWSRQSDNRFQPAVAKSQQHGPLQYGSQQYGHSGYRSGSYSRSAESYGSSAGERHGTSMWANRSPGAGFQRSDFGVSFGHFKGNGFAKSYGKRSHSGGSHLFGGGHAPKNFGGGKSHSHSGGGGHSGGHGHSGGKHHH
jgi:hypothetical protein